MVVMVMTALVGAGIFIVWLAGMGATKMACRKIDELRGLSEEKMRDDSHRYF